MVARKPAILMCFGLCLVTKRSLLRSTVNVRVRNSDSHLHRQVLLSRIRRKEEKEAMIRKILFSMIREVALPPGRLDYSDMSAGQLSTTT